MHCKIIIPPKEKVLKLISWLILVFAAFANLTLPIQAKQRSYKLIWHLSPGQISSRWDSQNPETRKPNQFFHA